MRTLVGHKLAILVLCQVGKSTVWSGSEDNLIKVWSVLDVSLRRTLSGHAGPVCSLVQMGPHVWSGSSDCTILVWDASSHALLFSLGHQGGYALLENVRHQIVFHSLLSIVTYTSTREFSCLLVFVCVNTWAHSIFVAASCTYMQPLK